MGTIYTSMKNWLCNLAKGREITNNRNEIINREDHHDIIKTPALGRSFRLGMLYDRVHDKIIPGETLLTMKDMENHTYKEKKKGCSFDVIYGDSSEDKSTVFKGDANLELNFLKGAAALGASGKFLSNTILKKKELRVSLTAEYIMLYKELEMKYFESHISNMKTTATHIVTAIEYGTNVTFTFDRTISENEDILEISGELKGMIEKIPSSKASGNVTGSMVQFEKNKTDKVSCKFCGDVILQENPTTYEDAVKCYKELPSYLTEDEAVPVTVWLYPIPKMSTPANNILQTINKEKKKHAIIALEELQRIYVSCNEIMWGYAYTLIPEVQYKMDQFKKTVQAFQEDFKDQVLTELLKEDNPSEEKMSPWMFRIDSMKRWISQKAETEINLLNTFIRVIMKGKIEILPSTAVEAKLVEHDHLVILNVVLPFSSGQYVKTEHDTNSHYYTPQCDPESHLHHQHVTTAETSSTDEKVTSWFADASIKTSVRKRIKRFLSLNSKKASRFEFFVTFTDYNNTELHGNRQSGAYAVLYEEQEKNDGNEFDLLSPKAEKKLCTGI